MRQPDSKSDCRKKIYWDLFQVMEVPKNCGVSWLGLMVWLQIYPAHGHSSGVRISMQFIIWKYILHLSRLLKRRLHLREPGRMKGRESSGRLIWVKDMPVRLF